MSQHSESPTIQYYDKHSEEYIGSTVSIDMETLYYPFLNGLPEGGSILDAGCGSGRDTKNFLDAGYSVTSIDASSEMVAATTRLSGQAAKKMQLQKIEFQEEFDGIWACASLLHVPLVEMEDVIVRLACALRPDGLCYLSFKEGQGERFQGDRLFVDFTELALRDWVNRQPSLASLRTWVTTDLRPGETQRWVNTLARKSSD
ncbi:class I SAM-dependent methyltransferase [Rubripirellula sp.]|nr:class I SAM-dependent methyltransferase [Rubripirellula sp.]MDB4634115.1 class I SAM-dependent methyltransferase [Rubripirellula sp.]